MSEDCRQGVVALGDSITRGHGGMIGSLGCQSWALWLAESLGLPYTGLAVDGAVCADVLAQQLPRATGRYDLACCFAGVNNVRGLDWDGVAFERDLDAVAAGLAACADRVLLVTIPLDLGRPRAGAKVADANAAIRRVASRRGALLLALDSLSGPPDVLPDAVHLTAFGQVAVADLAAGVLAADGMEVSVLPSVPAAADRSRTARVRFALSWKRMHARDLIRRASERARVWRAAR